MKKHLIKGNEAIKQVSLSVSGKTSVYFNVPMQLIDKVYETLKPLKSQIVETPSDDPWESSFKDIRDNINGEEIYKNSAITIRGARNREGLSQTALANSLGINRTNLSLLENAKRPVGKKLAQKLAKVFNIHYKVFLSD